MKTGQPKPKYIVGRWHFYLKILSFQHLHEIVEKEHQNYRVLSDQSLFFQHNQFFLQFLVQKLHYYFLINLQA